MAYRVPSATCRAASAPQRLREILRFEAVAVAMAIATLLQGAVQATPTSAAVRPHSPVIRDGTSRCTTAQLVVWLDTSGSGAAGSVYYDLEFTNEGAGQCTLSGYPGVSAVNLASTQLGAPAARNPTTAVRSVTLLPGASATAVLQITDTGVYSPSTCHAVEAAGLRVYPPAQVLAKLVPFPFSTCGARERVDLHVEAVEKGVQPN
jgi:hypothetical protein